MSALDSIACFGAAAIAAVFALLILLRKHRYASSWSFLGGMVSLSLASLFDGLLLSSVSQIDAERWQRLEILALIPAPALWLAFSVSYARGNSKESLLRWRFPLAVALLIPVGVAIFAGLPVHERPLESGVGWWQPFDRVSSFLNIFNVGAYFLALSNLEKTLRSSVGTIQWRIKFAILGLAVIFGTRIYTTTQALLYSGKTSDLIMVEALAVILGCLLLGVAYVRRGFAGLDVYPSRKALQNSATVLLVGGYLVVVGVLAQALARWGHGHAFRAQALLVLVATVLLGGLLLSDRLRLRIRQGIARHFHRPSHDYREVWTNLTLSLAAAVEQRELCERAARLIAGTFEVLSVDLWIADSGRQGMILAASTSGLVAEAPDSPVSLPTFQEVQSSRPVALGGETKGWTRDFHRLSAPQFQNGGNRICVPLISNEEVLGVIILADRVDGHPYELDEFDLLQCIGDQVAAALLRMRMTGELMQGKELEAFQTMSAFFVHDLKNAASSLSLTLENLPVHYNDPAFRTDAFRGIQKTVGRIQQLISRLSTLRDRLEINETEVDLNELIIQTFQQLGPEEVACVSHELSPVPKVRADPEQLQSVISNLLLNARDAVQGKGRIRVETSTKDGRAILSIEDDGCGMSPQFVRDSLFRPFQSTKKNGLGIGMFQSRQIIKAHRGSIEVETSPGHGTRFLVSLPVATPQS